MLDAIENIKDTVITIEDKLRKATDDSDAKIEDQVNKFDLFVKKQGNNPDLVYLQLLYLKKTRYLDSTIINFHCLFVSI